MSHNDQQNEFGNCRGQQWSHWSIKARVGSVIAGIIFVPAFLILFPFVTMQLWNWLMPALFKLPAIGFWQAVGLLLLSQILLKGNHFGRSRGSRWKKSPAPQSAIPQSAQPNGV